MNNYPRKF